MKKRNIAEHKELSSRFRELALFTFSLLLGFYGNLAASFIYDKYLKGEEMLHQLLASIVVTAFFALLGYFIYLLNKIEKKLDKLKEK